MVAVKAHVENLHLAQQEYSPGTEVGEIAAAEISAPVAPGSRCSAVAVKLPDLLQVYAGQLSGMASYLGRMIGTLAVGAGPDLIAFEQHWEG